MQAEMYRKEGPLPRQLVPPPFQLPTGKMKVNFGDADVRPQGKRECGAHLDIELGPTLLEQSNADACEENPFPRTGGFRDARGTFCWSRMPPERQFRMWRTPGRLRITSLHHLTALPGGTSICRLGPLPIGFNAQQVHTPLKSGATRAHFGVG